ncbi:YhgE/Pip domain-containing protein [Lysinibacillus sp. RSDA_15]|uniref:YhgE/Pip domain-containing protein n=1 Tax=Lysinibacillus TaxID=400634 RepID=UPI00056924F9|nr:ABC transporter permease [Lysinibacillus sphaericus]QPA55981.1 ABC transporter permease [Lysinibacillus sphaericus]QTB28587.1 ABC transporter permease [Lysinibacillus sphaericus]
MKGLQTLLSVRETYIGIVAAIAFQLIFFTIWMTAYDGVNERADELSIGFVVEDTGMGQQIVKDMEDNIPFTVKKYSSLKQAEHALNERQINMIMQIPANFTNQLQTGEKAEIIYSINQANASMAKNMMDSVAKQLTEEMNRMLYPLQQNQAIEIFSQQFAQLPFEQKTSQQINASVHTTMMSIKDHAVDATILKTNDVKGFAANFIPLMVIISSFVGAMVMIMQHQQAAQKVQSILSKWQLFFARQLLNVGVALTLPFLTIGLMHLFTISSNESFLSIYLFQSVMFLAFLCLAQVFVILFGNIGMVFNICALSLQLVTSGVLVPKTMLSEGYKQIAAMLPASYGADGYYTIIFGGSADNLLQNSSSLGIIILVTLTIATVTVAIKPALAKSSS